DQVQNIPIFAKPPAEDLRGFRELPAGHVIQWARFFEFDGSKLEPQPSRKIDSKLAFGISILPDAVAKEIHALAERDLKRGKALGLPSGQAIARTFGLPEDLILHAQQMKSLPEPLLRAFGASTPLFFYVLKEAEVLSEGRRLGPVGGRIVAEVLIGLLRGDPSSSLSLRPMWRRTAGEIGSKASALELDATDEERLASVARGYDLIVSTAGPDFRVALPVAKAAVAAGVHLCDIAADGPALQKVLSLDARAKEANVSIVTGIGHVPGISNLLMQYAANQLDKATDLQLCVWWDLSRDRAALFGNPAEMKRTGGSNESWQQVLA